MSYTGGTPRVVPHPTHTPRPGISVNKNNNNIDDIDHHEDVL